MIRVERTKTTEASVDRPKLIVAVPSELVNVDVAGDMDAARKVAGVMFPRGLQFFRHRRHVAVLPNRIGTADDQSTVVGGDAHGLGECSEVSVECAIVISNNNRFACLVSRNDEADPQPIKQFREIRSMHTVQGIFVR